MRNLIENTISVNSSKKTPPLKKKMRRSIAKKALSSKAESRRSKTEIRRRVIAS
jgi:hypothetical protein